MTALEANRMTAPIPSAAGITNASSRSKRWQPRPEMRDDLPLFDERLIARTPGAADASRVSHQPGVAFPSISPPISPLETAQQTGLRHEV